MTDPSLPQSLVIDTSAAVAIVLDEPGSPELVAHLELAPTSLMSAVTRVDLGMVLEARLGPAGVDVVHRFLRDAEIEVVPVDTDAADRALRGWRRFGKGRHPAGLNLGDCFVYALAERSGLPVLCTGRDFAATDLDVLGPAGAPAGPG